MRGVVVAAGPIVLADLEQELSFARELEHLVILGVVAGDPHVVLVVDEDPVLVQRPLVAGARAAPRAHEDPVGVELEHGRRRRAAERARRVQRGAALVLGQRLRPLDDPDVVAAIHRDPRGLTHEPVVRQRAGPPGIHLEPRRLPVAGTLGAHGCAEAENEADQRRQPERAEQEAAATPSAHELASSRPNALARSS